MRRGTGDLVVRTAWWRIALVSLVIGGMLALIWYGSFYGSGELDLALIMGPVFILAFIRFVLLEALISRLVLNQHELVVTDWLGRSERIPRESIIAVSIGKLVVPSRSRTRVIVVTSSGPHRPLIVAGAQRYRATELSAVWERLGRRPSPLGTLTVRELEMRFPGAVVRQSVRGTVLCCLGWLLAYLVVLVVVVLLLGQLMGLR
jgi:hypothetical protein